MQVLLLLLLFWCTKSQGYTIQGRFGHSAVQVNDSIYFYGGDSSLSSSVNQSEWLSDLAILPIHSSSYQLTDPPWKPASGSQNSVGGPSIYSHVAFMGGSGTTNSMIVVGGVMPPPQTDTILNDEEPTAYSYDVDLGRWNMFSLPSGNHLNRQGAACTTTDHGIAYIWGGKRALLAPPFSVKPVLSANMYRFDSVYPANSSIMIPPASEQPLLYPPLRYGHTQTLITDHRIVVLGGFDSTTGDAVSLADVWLFDINDSIWSQINAKLDGENKPANKSSHSQVLMPDGYSILVYGGYDGYHVYNDVAVLDTRTWTWTVKNTNVVVQGRADHTATLVGTNMIVAFGFTGVSTTLTVMADIEVLDITTWSWTSVYTPSSAGIEVEGGNTKTNIDSGRGYFSNIPNSSPSIAIVAGAVTGGLVVFVLILLAFYLLSSHHHQKKRSRHYHYHHKGGHLSTTSTVSSSSTTVDQTTSPVVISRPSNVSSPSMLEVIKFNDPPSLTEPPEYTTRRRSPAKIPHPLQINTNGSPPTRSDTINTTTTIAASSIIPSPWSPISRSDKSSDWMLRRASSTPTHYPRHHPAVMPFIANNISKPDDTFYPPQSSNLRRAATTVCESSMTQQRVQEEEVVDDDDGFDRQEFILQSDQVEKMVQDDDCVCNKTI